jgi:hypothetical protein
VTLHFRLFPFLSALLICLLTGLFLSAAPARAMEDFFSAQKEAVENPGGGMKVVTPLKACLDQLPPDEAAAVRHNYQKPYQECQLRLQALQRRRAEGKETADSTQDAKSTAGGDGKAAAKETAAESPRNFVRVRKDDGPRRAASHGDSGAKPPAAESRARPVWDSGYNR